MTLWHWWSKYDGGKLDAHPCGMVRITEDGCLSVEPDDDYYGGELSLNDSRELALAILEAQRKAKTNG